MRWVKGISRDMFMIAFRDWFGLQTNHADTLVTLFEHYGRSLTVKKLASLVSSHRPLSPNAIWERIRVLRSAMESEAIDFDERGYRLTETGMEECRLALRRAAETFVRHGFELPPVEAAIGTEFGSCPALRLVGEGAE